MVSQVKRLTVMIGQGEIAAEVAIIVQKFGYGYLRSRLASGTDYADD